MATFYMTHSAELYHYGVLGMKWGVRRYQNKDGSLTAAGKQRYGEVGKRHLTRDEKKDLKVRKKKLADMYKTTEYIDTTYYDAKRKADKYESKSWKEIAKKGNVSAKTSENLKKARARSDFYKIGHDQFNRTIDQMHSETVAKYGNKRVKDIPRVMTKQGEMIYRKSAPESIPALAIPLFFVGGAVGGALAGGLYSLDRTRRAKSYAKRFEKDFTASFGYDVYGNKVGPGSKNPKKDFYDKRLKTKR